MFLISEDDDKLLSISELATKFSVWAAHLSWGGSSYSICVKSASVSTWSNSKQSWTLSKVTSSGQSSSITDDEGSIEPCAESSKENVVNAFTKLDPLSVTVAVTFNFYNCYKHAQFLLLGHHTCDDQQLWYVKVGSISRL